MTQGIGQAFNAPEPEHTRVQMRPTLDGRKRWYYRYWLIERVSTGYEAHPAWRDRCRGIITGRTLELVEASIDRREERLR